MWDSMAINTYLIGSVPYLELPLIPGLAVLRDKATGWRKTMYRTLALGWRGTAREWVRLEKAISMMASSSSLWRSRCTPSCRGTSP